MTLYLPRQLSAPAPNSAFGRIRGASVTGICSTTMPVVAHQRFNSEPYGLTAKTPMKDHLATPAVGSRQERFGFSPVRTRSSSSDPQQPAVTVREGSTSSRPATPKEGGGGVGTLSVKTGDNTGAGQSTGSKPGTPTRARRGLEPQQAPRLEETNVGPVASPTTTTTMRFGFRSLQSAFGTPTRARRGSEPQPCGTQSQQAEAGAAPRPDHDGTPVGRLRKEGEESAVAPAPEVPASPKPGVGLSTPTRARGRFGRGSRACASSARGQKENVAPPPLEVTTTKKTTSIEEDSGLCGGRTILPAAASSSGRDSPDQRWAADHEEEVALTPEGDGRWRSPFYKLWSCSSQDDAQTSRAEDVPVQDEGGRPDLGTEVMGATGKNGRVVGGYGPKSSFYPTPESQELQRLRGEWKTGHLESLTGPDRMMCRRALSKDLIGFVLDCPVLTVYVSDEVAKMRADNELQVVSIADKQQEAQQLKDNIQYMFVARLAQDQAREEEFQVSAMAVICGPLVGLLSPPRVLRALSDSGRSHLSAYVCLCHET